jgi:micrococcal nuclease
LRQGPRWSFASAVVGVDCHGYALAQVFVVKGETRLWLQQELVTEGLARVYSFPDNRACVAELMGWETQARDQRKGIWGVAAYRIGDAGDDPEDIARLRHSYQLVEGVVVAVSEGSSRIYLNFGKDWRTDFTVEIERKDRDAFAAAGLDLGALAGKRLRVRGWIEWRNGPLIRASHPEQIEMLPLSPVPATPKPPGSVAL